MKAKEIEQIELYDPLESVSEEFPENYYKENVAKLIADSKKWSEARAKGDHKADSSPEVIAEVKRELEKNGASYEFMHSPAWWGKLETLLENPGTVGVLYAGGIGSRFIAPMLISMPSSVALCPAFLYGVTTDLKVDKITPEDPYYETVRREPLFKYIRVRSAFSGEVLRSLKPKKSIFYNCGQMFATRFITGLEGTQEAICTDIDPAVTRDRLFPNPTEAAHYTVLNRPNEELVEDDLIKGADYAESLGRLIYTFTEENYDAAKDFLEKAISSLKPGGVMVFDLNCEHYDWEKLLIPIAWARGKVIMTFLRDNKAIEKFVREKLLKDAPVADLIVKPVEIAGKDVGVVFAAVRK